MLKIKGMDAPKHCWECPCFDRVFEECIPLGRPIDSEFLSWFDQGFPDDCPVVREEDKNE